MAGLGACAAYRKRAHLGEVRAAADPHGDASLRTHSAAPPREQRGDAVALIVGLQSGITLRLRPLLGFRPRRVTAGGDLA